MKNIYTYVQIVEMKRHIKCLNLWLNMQKKKMCKT